MGGRNGYVLIGRRLGVLPLPIEYAAIRRRLAARGSVTPFPSTNRNRLEFLGVSILAASLANLFRKGFRESYDTEIFVRESESGTQPATRNG